MAILKRARGSRWIGGVVVVLAASWALARAGAAEPSASSREYDLKAVFLFNFTQFATWPEEAFENAAAPMTIGILGDDPFGTSLAEVVDNEVVRNRRLAVEHYTRVEDVKNCQVLFVAGADPALLSRALDAVGGRPILTVGESEEFERRGGMIRFVVRDNRIRLRIRLDAARSANLTISSKLLRQADIVEPGEKP